MVGYFMFLPSVAEVYLITKIDFMEQSPINNVQPEQKLNNEQMPIDTTSSPTIAKPNVGCSASKSSPIFEVPNPFSNTPDFWIPISY